MIFSIFKTKLSSDEKDVIRKEVREDLDKFYQTLEDPRQILEDAHQEIIEIYQRHLEKLRAPLVPIKRNCDIPNCWTYAFAKRINNASKNGDHHKLKVLMDEYESLTVEAKLTIDLYRTQS